LSLFPKLRKLLGLLDVSRLAGFVATAEQQHDFLLPDLKVDSIARSLVDAQLSHSFAYHLCIAEIAELNPC